MQLKCDGLRAVYTAECATLFHIVVHEEVRFVSIPHGYTFRDIPIMSHGVWQRVPSVSSHIIVW